MLVLIALRLQGGRSVPATDEPLKTLKKQVTVAKQKGLIAERKADVTAPGGGKPKKVAVLDITDLGEAALRAVANPEVVAALQAADKASFFKKLEADREALRQQLAAAATASSKGKAKVDPSKLIADVTKQVAALSDRLAKLETAVASQGDGGLLARIEAGFAALEQKLGGMPAAPPQGSGAVASGKTLADDLLDAYRTLCQFPEFNDEIIPLPRLYHEAKRARNDLSVESMHRELRKLWDQRKLQLKVINEVMLATEPEKAIHSGENMYYYVYWQPS